MSLTMYELSLPVFVHNLKSLSAILEKGAAYADRKQIAPEVLLETRLFPDMLPLSRQVQIACDMAARGSARLADAGLPTFADDETDFQALLQRIDNSIGFIKGFSAEQVNGAEDRTINFKTGGHELSFSGRKYLCAFVLPNLYFHITTAYDILRSNGVELGKLDYLGGK